MSSNRAKQYVKIISDTIIPKLSKIDSPERDFFRHSEQSTLASIDDKAMAERRTFRKSLQTVSRNADTIYVKDLKKRCIDAKISLVDRRILDPFSIAMAKYGF